MKKVFLCLSAFIIFSCSEQIDIENDSESDLPQLSSRAIVDLENVSVTNPDFINNWENMTSIVLNSSRPDNIRTASLPWVAASPSSLPENISYDVKKEDGWRMLMHTFKNYGLDEKQNYFILYNDFTGVLRVYYYCEQIPEANNSFMWNMRTTNSSSDYILGANTYPVKSLDISSTDNNMRISNYSNNEYSSLSYGWNAFEIPITYSTSNQNVEYLITAINTNISNIKLLGTSKGTINGTIISTTASGNSILTGAANLSKDAAKSYLDKVLKSDKIKLSANLKNGISNFVGGVVKNGVQAGLKLIFGNTSQTKDYEVNLTMQTEIELTGTSEFPSVAQVVPLNNINLKKCNGGNNLGVWNIEKTPKVSYNKYSEAFLVEEQGGILYPEPDELIPARLNIQIPFIRYEKPEIIVNPSIKKYLKTQSVTYELINCVGPHNSGLGIYYNGDLLNYMGDDVTGNYESIYKNSELSMYIWQFTSTYSDELLFSIEGYYKRGYKLVYDWTGSKDDTFVLVVTVNQTFDFNGKEIQVTSSKHFKTDFGMMTDWTYIYPIEIISSYVVNKDQILKK